MNAPETLTVVEVGPRDGLQNEPRLVPTAQKVALVDALAAAGLVRIEAASFVSPRWVPQMADGAEVMAQIARVPGVRYAALAPNLKGLEAALAAGVDEVAVFVAATEGFSRANLNASQAETLRRAAAVAAGARAAGLGVRGYVSCVTDCPVEGAVPPGAVAACVGALREMGCGEVSLGETLGRGTPGAVAAMLEAVLAGTGAGVLAGHFHDTGGRALENVAVAWEAGLRVFDSSVAGLGGCPYAPGAAGNLATEALVDWAAERGIATGVDRERLAEVATFARGLRHG